MHHLAFMLVCKLTYDSQEHQSKEYLQKKTTPDLFFTLPAEIRNRIYKYVLASGNHVDLDTERQSNEGGPPLPCLLRASRRIEEEALPMYYANQEFIVTIDGREEHHIVKFARWLRRTILRCGGKPMQTLVIEVTGPIHVFIERMLPLVDIVREFSDVHVDIKIPDMDRGWRKRRWDLVQEMCKEFVAVIDADGAPGYDMKARSAIVEAIEIGIRTERNGWSRKKMIEEFARYWINGSP